jgi:tetratricopeptide (TPR) repeat protein
MGTSSEAARSVDTSDATGRYRIEKQLAVGGMGAIYIAFDALARREVAYKRLKVTNESSRPRLTALFEREYNALRRLQHPNIIEVFDYGLDTEGPYYTMELLAGKDLAAAAPLPLAQAARVLRDVASALALLHARRIVHRDVTPANVRLAHDGRAKLLDFGALAEFGVAKEVVGTPSFIAPECLVGGKLDARTDLFALGGLAYWVLTRRHAYPARSIGDLMEAWELPVVPPSEHVPALPKEVDELVLSLLERDPAARPESAAHVIERLTTLANLAPEQDEAQVAFSYLTHPPLVGRDLVLQQARRFIDEATRSEGRAVIVEGASGLGRSALIEQLAVDAQLAGANVLRFQPSGKREAELAASVLQWMRALAPELWSAQLAKNPALVRQTRAPLHLASETPAQISERRTKVTSAMQAAVEDMSREAPLVLLVDDLHRADVESLSLLASLARVTARSRILLILALEDGATSSDANALLNLRAVSTPLVLRPLTESDVDTMVETVFGSVPNAHRLSRYLHAQSGGNPGQCMDVCRLLLQQKEITYALGAFALPFDPRGEVKGSRALSLTRLADLSETSLSLVRLLSLSEGPLGSTQVKSALGLDDKQLFAASEQLCARNLVRRRGEDFALASESLRGALRDSLDSAQTTALHAVLAKCVVEHGDGTTESKLAACSHLLNAGREDEAIGLVWEPLRRGMLPLASVAACVPVLERLLAIMRKRGHPDEHCWMLLWPLVIAGYWGELNTVRPYRDPALAALANLSGMALANRLSPRLGKKLALVIGIFYGIFKVAFTPERFRPVSYAEIMQRFFSAVTMTTAVAASAFEPEVATRVASLLDPAEAMKEDSPGRVAREFAVATAETCSGQLVRAGERYGWILAQLEKHRIFDEVGRAGFRDGATHGRAQALVTSGAPNSLELADELARCHAFFGPHAEIIKMTFHGYRGEKELSDFHRKQAEMLALQGGVSWTMFAMLGLRTAYNAMGSQDTLAVMQAAVDLERVVQVAPNCAIYRDLCRAYVAMVRGQLDAALEIYERIASAPNARMMPAVELDASFHAEALMRAGKFEQAKARCEHAIAQRRAQGTVEFTLRFAIQQLAMAEARLGNFARAKELLERLEPAVLASEAPLPIGAVCRDRARIALMERDEAAFDTHFEGMVSAFRATKNQSLIQQCRRLLAEAEKSGLVASPLWTKHQLVAPINTQDLSSETPEHTELVETYS